MPKSIGVSVFFVLTSLAGRGAVAREDEPDERVAKFGEAGQWVPTLQTFGQGGGFAFVHRKTDGDWETSIHPAIDYFVGRNFSLGLALGFDYDSVDTGTTLLDVGARAGFNVNIASGIGLWPTAGIFFYHLTGNGMQTGKDTNLEIFAPLLFHLVPHAFIGVGPSLDLGLSPHDAQYGIDFVLGAWI